MFTLLEQQQQPHKNNNDNNIVERLYKDSILLRFYWIINN